MSTDLYLPDPTWAPRYFTRRESPVTEGPDVCDFAELLLSVSKGFKAGAPLAFTNWQRWLMDTLFERRESDGRLRYRRAVVGLPRKNGKSLLGTSIALYHMLYGPQGAQVYSAAGSRQQASIVFDEARQQVLNSPTLSRHFKVYRSHITVPKKGSVYRALSADAMGAHGLDPSLVIADEVHGWPSSPMNKRGDELWAALESGSGARPESLLLAITTAGGQLDTLLGRLYEYGKQVASGEIDDPSFGFAWWEADATADPRSPQTWRSCNPNLAEGLFDEEDFVSAVSSAGAAGLAEFRRFRLNQWVRLAGEDFISATQWDAAASTTKRIMPGDTVVLGFDGSVSGDATALVAMTLDGHTQILNLWEPDPRDPDWTVDRQEVNAAIHEAFDTLDVRMLFADPAFFESELLDWDDHYPRKVTRIPQTANRVAPMAQQFLADLTAGEISHGNDPRLTRHVLNAVAHDNGGFRKEKRHSPRKVDALAATVLANGARHMILEKNRKGAVMVL